VKLAAALVVLAACDRHPPPLASCADHLGGVWVTDDGAARWQLRDGGDRLDAYPLTRELPVAPPGTIAAPAMLDLRRRRDEVTGNVVRRWHRGGETCVVRAPARVRGCRDDRLTLTVESTAAPADWTRCQPSSGPTATYLLRRTWP
jgi:hypothetical protein